MEFIHLITGSAGTLLSYLIPFIFVLTIVVFFHELGHFLVARWCGVSVSVFSVGFGPEIVGFNDRRGTRWRLSIIPLGGYVRFIDDENAASIPDSAAPKNVPGGFQTASVWRRIAIVAAGPVANFILAIVIFATLFATAGRYVMSADVDSVRPGSAAAEAGIQPGDRILKIDGVEIDSFTQMQRIVSGNADRPLEIVLLRAGREMTVTATPQYQEIKDRFGNVQRVGLLGISRNPSPDDIVRTRAGPLEAVWMGVEETWFVIDRTFSYLGGIIMGRESADQLGGPIRIAQVSGQVASVGILALINMSAILSVSIGLLNLFPVPMLDGGHLLFYGIEAARGRPLSQRVLDIGYRIGLALVLMLMIFATWNDLIQLSIL
ncbi:MAG: RIP metalloprotease RseP [Rhodobiaceae bacterium]|nr:RIP metalloprotease RseP [Rhodobiaceae bacterium]MCC0057501.1 RIP metalloprotease RseP [Rhodobiaceae bacterium]